MQALGPLSLGVIDRFGLNLEHVAAMISSHNGEPVHEGVSDAMLTAAGLDRHALRCGAATPNGDPKADKTRIRHGCSGKHAGFLCGSVILGEDPARYLDADGELQSHVIGAVVALCDLATDPPDWDLAIDGCSAPTFIMPLRKLALGIARVTNPDRLPEHARRYAPHCETVVEAAAAHPHLVAGTEPGRFDTTIIGATQGRVFSKGGADGVQVIGVPGAGVAFAGKIDDGSFDTLYLIACQLLQGLGHISAEEAAALGRFSDTVVRNADGIEVGEHVLAGLNQ